MRAPTLGNGVRPDSGIMVDMSNLAGKKLERPLAGRWVAGVAAGFAAYFDLDATLIRVIFAVTAFIGGIGIVVYLAAWLLVPEEGESSSILEKLVSKTGT
jgi:phage shock protein PspC (stress-responsive transcriptional regulator)